jgi:hypothetical protein
MQIYKCGQGQGDAILRHYGQNLQPQSPYPRQAYDVRRIEVEVAGQARNDGGCRRNDGQKQGQSREKGGILSLTLGFPDCDNLKCTHFGLA